MNLKTESHFGLIGTWKGFEFPDMPTHLRDTDLNELLDQVRQSRPDFAETPEIKQQRRACRELLIAKTALSSQKINELLDFEGTAKEFKPVLKKAFEYLFDNIASELSEQLEILRSLRVQRLWELLKEGELGFKAVQVFGQTNKILDTYSTTLSKIMRGVGGVNDTLEVQGIVVGAGYSVPATSQTDLDHQIGSAKVPSDSVYTGYQTTFLTSFLTADNNGAATTVASASDASTITLTSATGMEEGDRILVTGTGLTAGGEMRTIATLVGAIATVDTPFSITPPNGATVVQSWGETGILINGDSVLGTRSRISDGGFAKTNVLGRFLESAITLRIVGP